MLTDLGNPETYSQAVKKALDSNISSIRNFWNEEKRRDEIHQSPQVYVPSAIRAADPNPFKEELVGLIENYLVDLVLEIRVRVWHYTRLLDSEIDAVKGGLRPASKELLHAKVAQAIKEGLLDETERVKVIESSPLVTQAQFRTGLICAVSVPLPVDHDGVEILLKNWGGEITYFHQQSPEIIEKLQRIGRARVIELSAPVAGRNGYMVAKSMVNTYGAILGLCTERSEFDFLIDDNFEAIEVLKIHTENDPVFPEIGRTYPYSIDRRE